MKVQIGRYNVELKEEFGWYDRQELAAIIAESGLTEDSQDIRGNLRAFESIAAKVIVEITEGEGDNAKKIPYDLDWLKGLTVEEGTKLSEELPKVMEGLAEKKEQATS